MRNFQCTQFGFRWVKSPFMTAYLLSFLHHNFSKDSTILPIKNRLEISILLLLIFLRHLGITANPESRKNLHAGRFCQKLQRLRLADSDSTVNEPGRPDPFQHTYSSWIYKKSWREISFKHGHQSHCRPYSTKASCFKEMVHIFIWNSKPLSLLGQRVMTALQSSIEADQ